MRAHLAATALLLLACDSGGATFDGGDDVASGPSCDGGCGTSVAVYCQSQSCPSDPAAALAELCDAGEAVKVYGGCGHITVLGYGVDTSQEIFFDSNGGLLAIFDTSSLGSCCLAGPTGFSPPSLQGCTLSTTSCSSGDAGADSGDASDAGVD